MQQLRKTLETDLSIAPIQVVESVAYSLAMIVRAALGLHAAESYIAVLYQDTLEGWIALATARHLVNAGSHTRLISYAISGSPSTMLLQLLKPLRFLGLPESDFDKLASRSEINDLLSSCHNLLCGVSPDSLTNAHNSHSELISCLNDHSIPVHCINAPLGISLHDGKPVGEPLYASSTLSLGIPFQALAAAHEFVGRHYLADISLPFSIIQATINAPFPCLFSEQPVIQIFPQEKDPA